MTDLGVRSDYWLRPNLGLSAWVQYERWLFPVIQPNAARECDCCGGDAVSAAEVVSTFHHRLVSAQGPAIAALSRFWVGELGPMILYG